MGCTGLHWTVLGCTGLWWAVLGSTGLYWTVLGSTGLYWTGLGFTRLNWAVVDCSRLYYGVMGCTGRSQQLISMFSAIFGMVTNNQPTEQPGDPRASPLLTSVRRQSFAKPFFMQQHKTENLDIGANGPCSSEIRSLHKKCALARSFPVRRSARVTCV